ncbi:MAG TPA: hypothetical protein IAA38_06890 [Candidatus Ruminococcus gallistercoris]|nr:hypothetical protein [Candidatus Ruminococcus gallistercoris]
MKIRLFFFILIVYPSLISVCAVQRLKRPRVFPCAQKNGLGGVSQAVFLSMRSFARVIAGGEKRTAAKRGNKSTMNLHQNADVRACTKRRKACIIETGKIRFQTGKDGIV